MSRLAFGLILWVALGLELGLRPALALGPTGIAPSIVRARSMSDTARACSGCQTGVSPSGDMRVTATSMASNGSEVETGQSLPETRNAPASRKAAFGYSHLERSSPRKGSVRSVM